MKTFTIEMTALVYRGTLDIEAENEKDAVKKIRSKNPGITRITAVVPKGTKLKDSEFQSRLDAARRSDRWGNTKTL